MDSNRILIGISGKIGSGKDLVGSLIAYNIYLKQRNFLLKSGYLLPWDEDQQFNLNEISKLTPDAVDSLFSKTLIEKRKFAEPLKEFASNLLKVPVYQFEDQEYKKSILPVEWNYVRTKQMQIPVGLFKDAIVDMPETSLKSLMSVRDLLIRIGDGCRKVVHPDIWCNALFSQYDGTRDWIITDVRYPNEKERVEKLGGFCIRVNRKQKSEINNASETSLDKEIFKHTIYNYTTIEALNEKVRNILITENII